MKRYLMRGAMSPLDPATVESVMFRNTIGGNAGNLLYLSSIYRTLLTEDAQIDMDHYRVENGFVTEEEIDRINQEYDAYLVPLADAFRNDFIAKLHNYAHFFERLTIPCIVLSVGIRAPYEPNLDEKFKFDDAVRHFVEAACSRSSKIGVRGEITGAYLKKLGFREAEHFSVIGCPSVFTFGEHLQQRPLKVDEINKLAVNIGQFVGEDMLAFVTKLMQSFPGSQWIGQDMAELFTLYLGGRNGAKLPKTFPAGPEHPLYQQDRVRFFYNAKQWIEFMKTMDLSVGERLHGNVAAILAGTPALFFPVDARMRELTEYHNFPRVPSAQITPDSDLADLISRVDLGSHLKCHKERFNHFIDFLQENELDNIYSSNRDRADAPLDSMLPRTPEPIKPYIACTRDEAAKRIHDFYRGQLLRKDEVSARLNKKLKEKDALIREYRLRESEQDAYFADCLADLADKMQGEQV